MSISSDFLSHLLLPCDACNAQAVHKVAPQNKTIEQQENTHRSAVNQRVPIVIDTILI